MNGIRLVFAARRRASRSPAFCNASSEPPSSCVNESGNFVITHPLECILGAEMKFPRHDARYELEISLRKFEPYFLDHAITVGNEIVVQRRNEFLAQLVARAIRAAGRVA